MATGSIVAAMVDLAEQLTTDDVMATHDPSVAASNRPCLLVAPPSMDYSERTNTWSIVALSSHPAGGLDALDELDGLVRHTYDVLHVETATPASYALTPETGTIPAYLMRVTT